jgi:hypothetical protein
VNISEGFGRFLIANEVIGAITSEVRPILLPDDHALPAITYAQQNDARIDLLNSSSSELSEASFVVNIYGKTYAATRSLADVVRVECTNATLLGDITARRIENTVDFDRYEQGSKLHSVSQTYTIWYLIGA